MFPDTSHRSKEAVQHFVSLHFTLSTKQPRCYAIRFLFSTLKKNINLKSCHFDNNGPEIYVFLGSIPLGEKSQNVYDGMRGVVNHWHEHITMNGNCFVQSPYHCVPDILTFFRHIIMVKGLCYV